MKSKSPNRFVFRAKLVVILLAGAAAAVVVGLLAAEWRTLVAHWRCWHLDEASSFEEAEPTLEALAAAAEESNTSCVLLGKLGLAHSRLTVWFFGWVAEGANAARRLGADFGQRLERDETLLECWSHFVRWDEGANLGNYLDTIAATTHRESPEVPCSSCGTSLLRGERIVFSGNHRPALRSIAQDTVSSNSLRTLAIAWFLGMSPFPSRGVEYEQQLRTWLNRPAPFLRHLAYDATKGRCKRENEMESMPELQPYGKRDLAVPDKPLANWVGPAPDLVLAPTAEIILLPNSGIAPTTVSP